MSIARIRPTSFKSKEKVDIMEALYDKNWRTYLPTREDILAIRTDDLTVLFVTIIPMKKLLMQHWEGLLNFWQLTQLWFLIKNFFCEAPWRSGSKRRSRRVFTKNQ